MGALLIPVLVKDVLSAKTVSQAEKYFKIMRGVLFA